jgi:acyl-CoA synthetase (AMP-forming)/AMP-acid ligase II
MNLAAVLEGSAERDGEREAVVQRGGLRLTYAQLRERAARIATGLEELGLGRGDRVAAVLPNRHETVELYWAAQWAGATFVPVSWRLAPEEVEYIVADSGARHVARET